MKNPEKAEPANEDVGVPIKRQPPKEWYFRGYLPHRDARNLLQTVTFRLADSLPEEKLDRLEEELKNLPETLRGAERPERRRPRRQGGCLWSQRGRWRS